MTKTAKAIVQINDGAECFIDCNEFIWPPEKYRERDKFGILKGITHNMVFIAEKRKGYWDCRAPGAGLHPYGNGSIFADDVKMLTPMQYNLTEEDLKKHVELLSS